MTLFQKLTGLLGKASFSKKTLTGNAAASLLSSLLTMAWFVEARDPYTGGHLWRVSRYSRLLAERAGLGDTQSAQVSLGGFLHDLGKIGVPDAILRKTERLTDEEYEVIKTHPDMGFRMLAGHPLASLVKDAIQLHHERPDGRGYPLGLTGGAIPEMARIVGICDAFDAMTSHRPYRKGMPKDRALDILASERGTQFDRRLTDFFISLDKSGELDHIIGHTDEGIPLQSCPMCGPTLVLRKDHRAGQHLFCRNCAGEFRLIPEASGLLAEPTGQKGRPIDLEPELDSELIKRTVEWAAVALPFQELVQAAG